MKLDVLGVKIDQVDLEQALKIVDGWVKQTKKRYIVTVNPEFVMKAREDKEFREILNKADLAIADGVGLKLADKRLKRVAGTELMVELIKKGYKTVLAGGKSGIAQKAAAKLGVVGMTEPNVEEINRIKPDLLFVGLGMVKQEKWIVKNLAKLQVKVAMGVGGALDQVAKPWLKAPKLVSSIGLEWLWRLIMQPWRLKRQLILVKFLNIIKR